MLFDAHLHLRDERLWPYHETYLEAMIAEGIEGYLDCASHPMQWARALPIRSELNAFEAYGIHPWYATQATPEKLQLLADILRARPQACVGEIGLDGIHSLTPTQRAQQVQAFEVQIALAITFQRPVILHGARAWQALFDTLLPVANAVPAFLFHGANFAPEALVHPFFKARPNAFFSFNTSLLRPQAKTIQRLLSAVPDGRILIETDAPDFLPPDAKPLIPATRLQHPTQLVAISTTIEQHFGRHVVSGVPNFLLF